MKNSKKDNNKRIIEDYYQEYIEDYWDGYQMDYYMDNDERSIGYDIFDSHRNVGFNFIDMNSFYGPDVLRERKINSILGLPGGMNEDTKITIADFIKKSKIK